MEKKELEALDTSLKIRCGKNFMFLFTFQHYYSFIIIHITETMHSSFFFFTYITN